MKKTLIAAGIAAAMATPAAMANVTIYGKMRVAASQVDENSNTAGAITENDAGTVDGIGSRIGFKGSEDLGNGLSAKFQIEWDIDGSIDGNVGDPINGARNTWLGLAGGFGEVRAGRHDTPEKMSTGFVDVFGDTKADYDGEELNLTNLRALRATNVLAYISPKMNGFQLIAASIAGEDGDGIETDNNEDADGFLDSHSASLTYSNGPLKATVAYSDYAEGVFVDGETLKDWRAAIGYAITPELTVNAMYAEREVLDAGDSVVDDTVTYVSAAYKMGNNTLKAAFASQDNDNDNDVQAYAFGVNHALSKRTSFDVLYAKKDWDDTGAADRFTNDGKVYSVQLNHNF